jgi:hypothetical protein
MATKRKAKKRAVRKSGGKKTLRVFDLKKAAGATALKKALKKAGKQKVRLIVLNAPFKLAA